MGSIVGLAESTVYMLGLSPEKMTISPWMLALRPSFLFLYHCLLPPAYSIDLRLFCYASLL